MAKERNQQVGIHREGSYKKIELTVLADEIDTAKNTG